MIGYYRFPTIHRDRVVFVAEDDLWMVSTEGGDAYRLTANPGTELHPRFSRDGTRIAFVGRDEGRLDAYVVSAQGGSPERITYFGANTQVLGWEDDNTVVVGTDYQQPFEGWLHLWKVPVGGVPVPFGWGPARAISYQRNGPGVVIGRNSFDPARWKRYRGGRAGSLWIDRRGDGEFAPLVTINGNLADPMWIGGRIYFLSDHEGVGNLYSVTPTGSGLTRHTHHRDFYARFASSDGRQVVYHCGADLWILDPRSEKSNRLEVNLPSARPQRNRRFVPATTGNVESIALHPQGHSLALTVRGGAYSMPFWEGVVVRHGPVSEARQRLATWLAGGETLVMVSDEGGEDQLVVRPQPSSRRRRGKALDLGRLRSVHPSPVDADKVAVTNHRHELLVVELARDRARVIHHSPYSWIAGVDWSPDGRYLAFGASSTRTTSSIYLHELASGTTTMVGAPEFEDRNPVFDPEGKYLAFLSTRSFEPIPDLHFHDYGFPRAVMAMLIPLAATTPSPFSLAQRTPRAPGAPSDPPPGEAKPATRPGDVPESHPEPSPPPPPDTRIDLDGIDQRILSFPLPAGIYSKIALAKGKALLLTHNLERELNFMEENGSSARLDAWDFANDKVETVADGVTDFALSQDGKVLALRLKKRLRVVAVGFKDDKSGNDRVGRETGFIDLDRLRVEVIPGAEWKQMFSEAWRLQRDYYWWESMGGVDWPEIHDRYLGLVDRVASRAEFSDLMWEMQGELGTSHAYELGGDYRPAPVWTQGHLGAELALDGSGWRITRLPRGDSWDRKANSPLLAPSLGLAEGDRILAVDGRQVDARVSPNARLVERGGRAVELTVRRGRAKAREVVVNTLKDEFRLWYRDWVNGNRSYLRERSEGRTGYIHIPDMGAAGFSEFHRSWKWEVDREGLVVDVRFNRGGNVSQLLLERLLRQRVGYRITRWRQPSPMPDDSPAGPMVCLTNENAGSDGDIFSHVWKLHRLGPLIGTRTWGGVVGIWPQQSLVDGTVTTQPEFHTWFTDVGYGVENFGTSPDLEVVNTPRDYATGFDRQLEVGLEELTRIMDAAPALPEFGDRPSTRAPDLL